MGVSVLPVDQRVIGIDSRRFASVEKALVELITNCDDSYSRLERRGIPYSGKITISFERHKNGAVLSVADEAEGMSFERVHFVLTYGGAYSSLAQGEAAGRGYFGRGLKQAIYGLGYGWIESLESGMYSRVDLYRALTGEYLYDDWDRSREAVDRDYVRMQVPAGKNGTQVTIIVDNPQTSIPLYSSLEMAVRNNIYLRDILRRRDIRMVNLNQPKKARTAVPIRYEEPQSETLVGPEEPGGFSFQGVYYPFDLTLKRARDTELVLKGDERTNGLLVISGTAVLDCQFFKFENQLGTEYLFGMVNCDGLAQMLAKGYPVISDEREGLNMKEPFVLAFAEAVSRMLTDPVKSEQLRLSHFDSAKTSQKTKTMIESVLQKMNRIAVEDLGIILPLESSADGQAEGPAAALRFVTHFYYRKAGQPFHITMTADRNQLPEDGVLSFKYDVNDTMTVEPHPESIPVSELPEDGRLVFTVTGNETGEAGMITVTSGDYEASGEFVISDTAPEKAYGHPTEKHRAVWDEHKYVNIFKGYELRSLNNDMDRAIYSPEEHLILINTEAPTVRLYVDAHGQFRDGARLLLAELFLDVITDELARRYIDRTRKKGQPEAYRKAKQDLVRRYGVEVHSIMIGE